MARHFAKLISVVALLIGAPSYAQTLPNLPAASSSAGSDTTYCSQAGILKRCTFLQSVQGALLSDPAGARNALNLASAALYSADQFDPAGAAAAAQQTAVNAGASALQANQAAAQANAQATAGLNEAGSALTQANSAYSLAQQGNATAAQANAQGTAGLNEAGAANTTANTALTQANLGVTNAAAAQTTANTALTTAQGITAASLGALPLATGGTVSGKVKVAVDDTTSVPAQFQLRGLTNSNQNLLIGYNTSANFGSIQAILQGTGNEPLYLNPSGGSVYLGQSPAVNANDLEAATTSWVGNYVTAHGGSGSSGSLPVSAPLLASNSSGVAQSVTVGSGLSLTGGTLSASNALSSLTVSGTATLPTIAGGTQTLGYLNISGDGGSLTAGQRLNIDDRGSVSTTLAQAIYTQYGVTSGSYDSAALQGYAYSGLNGLPANTVAGGIRGVAGVAIVGPNNAGITQGWSFEGGLETTYNNGANDNRINGLFQKCNGASSGQLTGTHYACDNGAFFSADVEGWKHYIHAVDYQGYDTLLFNGEAPYTGVPFASGMVGNLVVGAAKGNLTPDIVNAATGLTIGGGAVTSFLDMKGGTTTQVQFLTNTQNSLTMSVVGPAYQVNVGGSNAFNVSATGLGIPEYLTSGSTGSSPSYILGNNSATNVSLVVNGASGNNRYIELQSSGVTRWRALAIGTPETGANAGSDFSICSYADGGANLACPLAINRASGLVTVSAVNSSSYAINGTAGVSCSAGSVNLATFTVANGLVTHC